MTEKQIDPALKPPKVFIVPFLLLTVPAFIVGTICSFISIGWKSGMAGVLRIYMAQFEREYEARRKEARRQEAEAIARQLEEALNKRGMGEDVHVVSMEPDKQDKE